MAHKSATTLIFTAIALVAIGLVMLSSTAAYSSISSDIYFEVKRQAAWLGIGTLACLIAAFFDYRWLRKGWIAIYLAACGLLVLCFVPEIGYEVHGAKRWIRLWGDLRMQPSEFARLGIVLSLAAWFASQAGREREFIRGFLLPCLILATPLALIVTEVDLGATLLIGGVCGLMMFIAGTRFVWLGSMLVAGASGFWWLVMQVPNRAERIQALFDLEKYQLGLGMQQWRALIAFGSGGVEGLGLGAGRQKLGHFPFANTDFIFPIIGEELGLRFSLLVVLLFLVFAICGFVIAAHARDRFGKLLGFGVTGLVVFQAVINIGVTTAVLPNKGIPLPFISYGGSNLLGCLIGIGILLNIYRVSGVQGLPVQEQVDRAKVPVRL